MGLPQSPPPPCGQLGLLLEVELNQSRSGSAHFLANHCTALSLLPGTRWISMQSSRLSQGFKRLGSSEFHRMLEGPGCSGCDSKAGTVRNMWLALVLVELRLLTSWGSVFMSHAQKTGPKASIVTFSTSLGVEAKGHMMPVSFGESFNHPSQRLQESTFWSPWQLPGISMPYIRFWPTGAKSNQPLQPEPFLYCNQ